MDTMRTKPKVCLVDEDPQVHVGWKNALKDEVILVHYRNPDDLWEDCQNDSALLSCFDCVVVNRFYNQPQRDTCSDDITAKLRSCGASVIFLNWQGYLTKEEIDTKFDGRLFNRYGVRWQTLRTRIQKTRNKKVASGHKLRPDWTDSANNEVIKEKAKEHYLSRPVRVQNLLKTMTQNATGSHREKLQYLLDKDYKAAEQLLEAIYNRLLVSNRVSTTCPSQYINSSPVVAKNILKEVLYD